MISATTAIERSYWLVFYQERLLALMDNGKAAIPLSNDLAGFELEQVRKIPLGTLSSLPCYTAEVLNEPAVPENMKFIGLRRLYGLIEEDLFWLAGRAFQIINWDRTHQYCGQCGARTEERLNEYAKVCPKCGFTSYPRISPVVIVAVLKDDQILLIQSNHFKVPFYTVISGFVEPGETLEECLRREVKEEVGVEVKNISYFGSQPWPFPNSLMIGFTAEYDGGEIIIDKEEISEARWFSVKRLPDLPGSISIARQLIDWFIKKNNNYNY
ncbi:NAD(+) diphosphatase [Pelotomaculum terephthalicicum JT]|uniref:NAD(+) diphosphatase n=1 Tax=Pelotomaculum terephthalicicum TaxID=206393 RepID=UPI0009CE105E|nr:NAD(+) diphosphatase [Pelotomaculum terephthalicicum]MCG9969305.1 NAD(+) diphosphatase [Pelotomaculum terephthalicicum JT]OPY62410.1 MAG: NADH pyrophosphatase [Pelotomaculum sp. PtaU1.Bin065]